MNKAQCRTLDLSHPELTRVAQITAEMAENMDQMNQVELAEYFGATGNLLKDRVARLKNLKSFVVYLD